MQVVPDPAHERVAVRHPADRVLAALLLEHDLPRILPGLEQAPVLDLPVELAIRVVLRPGEVDAGEVDAGEPFDAGLNNTGESCADPLVMAQATVSGGLSTWVIPAGGVATTDTTMGCDPNGIGPDVVIEYVKTTDTLANGGSRTSTSRYGAARSWALPD